MRTAAAHPSSDWRICGRFAASTLMPACAVALGGALRAARVAGDLSTAVSRGDASEYLRMGLGLRHYGLLLDPYASGSHLTAHRGALYPSFIALAAFLLPGHGADGVRVAQAVLGVLCIVLTYVLGALVHSRACGAIAALCLAGNRLAVFFTGQLYIESFFLFLVLLASISLAEWAREGSSLAAATAGFWIGVSLTCRSTLFALPALLALLAARRGGASARRGALFLCAYGLLLPWTLRNAVVFREFVPFERHAANMNLYTASLRGLHTVPNDSMEPSLRAAVPRWDAMSGDERGRELFSLAAANIRRHPARYALDCARRGGLFAFWLGRELGWVWSLLLIVGLFGIRRAPGLAVPAGILAYWVLIHAPMAVAERYLLPAIPLACVLAGAGACALLARAPAVPSSSYRSAACGAGVLSASRSFAVALYALGVFFLALESRARALPFAHRTALPPPYGLKAYETLARGRFHEAAASMAAELRADPRLRWSSKAYSDLGTAELLAGEAGKARRDLQRAVKLDFLNAEAHLDLCRLALSEDRPSSGSASCGWAAAINERAPVDIEFLTSETTR